MVELERALIALALLDRKACDIVLNLDETYFDDPVMKQAFIALKSFKTTNPNADCDIFTLASMLTDEHAKKSLFQVSMLGYQSFDGQVKERLATEFVRQLTKAKIAKDLRVTLNDVSSKLISNPHELAVHLSRLQDAIGQALVRLADISDDEDDEFVEFREIFSRKEQLVVSGIPTLDDALRSVVKGDLFVVAGRTSVGKTALAIQLAANSALMGKKVLYVTLEMKRSEIFSRFLSHIGFVRMNFFFNPSHRQTHVLKQLALAYNTFKRLNIKIIDSSAYSEAFDTPQLALAMQSFSPDIVVIDYLHLMAAKDEGMVEALAELSRELKRLALRYDSVIIGLSQINRTAEASEADLENIYYSSALGHAASQVLMIRPKQVADNYRIVELALTKNRNGRVVAVKSVFCPAVMRFVAA